MICDNCWCKMVCDLITEKTQNSTISCIELRDTVEKIFEKNLEKSIDKTENQ